LRSGVDHYAVHYHRVRRDDSTVTSSACTGSSATRSATVSTLTRNSATCGAAGSTFTRYAATRSATSSTLTRNPAACGAPPTGSTFTRYAATRSAALSPGTYRATNSGFASRAISFYALSAVYAPSDVFDVGRATANRQTNSHHGRQNHAAGGGLGGSLSALIEVRAHRTNNPADFLF
jgi:hypothetical protein